MPKTIIISPTTVQTAFVPKHPKTAPPTRRRRTPALGLECPQCGELAVRKGLREYKHSGLVERFHCCGPNGCRVYHMRDPETYALIETPENHRKPSRNRGKRRLTPNMIEEFVGVAESVAEFLEGANDNDRESLAAPFREHLIALQEHLAPHLRRPTVEDRVAIAVKTLGIDSEGNQCFFKPNKGTTEKLEVFDIPKAAKEKLESAQLAAYTQLRGGLLYAANALAVLRAASHKQNELPE